MNTFFHLIILDASGSMDRIRTQALDGCNETIQSVRGIQKKDPTCCHYLSLVTFNSEDRTNRIYDCQSVDECRDLTNEVYIPNGCTPLYDCVGLSICHLQDDIKRKLRDNPEQKTEVLVTIITDGLENSSTLFDAAKVKSLVEECKAAGWTFAYIGANQDEVLEAGKMGIHNTMAFTQNEEGTREMFEDFIHAQANYCMAAPCMSVEEKEIGFFAKPKRETKEPQSGWWFATDKNKKKGK